MTNLHRGPRVASRVTVIPLPPECSWSSGPSEMGWKREPYSRAERSEVVGEGLKWWRGKGELRHSGFRLPGRPLGGRGPAAGRASGRPLAESGFGGQRTRAGSRKPAAYLRLWPWGASLGAGFVYSLHATRLGQSVESVGARHASRGPIGAHRAAPPPKRARGKRRRRDRVAEGGRRRARWAVRPSLPGTRGAP